LRDRGRRDRAGGVTNHAVLVFSSQGGSDAFLGGNGANGYLFAADDLTAADTVHGGTGIDNLILKTAGTLDASAFTHVSGIETLILADGTNHVMLTVKYFHEFDARNHPQGEQFWIYAAVPLGAPPKR